MAGKERKKKKRDDFVDDGRTIANMNIDGMPWNNRIGGIVPPQVANDKDAADDDNSERTQNRTPRAGNDGSPPYMGAKETRALIKGVMLAVLLVGAVFLVALAGFILFCIYVWFR